jgi:hypothetical protein
VNISLHESFHTAQAEPATIQVRIEGAAHLFTFERLSPISVPSRRPNPSEKETSHGCQEILQEFEKGKKAGTDQAFE